MDNTTFLTRRHALQWAAAASASSTLSAFGQSDWPQGKAITFVVPFTAGSGTDVIARTIAEKLGARRWPTSLALLKPWRSTSL